MISTSQPFVLLDDARQTGAAPARLYSDPLQIMVAHNAAEFAKMLTVMRGATANGHHVAGYIGYEAGHALQQAEISGKSCVSRGEKPMAWLGIFDKYQEFSSDVLPSLLPDPHGAWLGDIVPTLDRSAYASAFAKVQDYISAGDIYQANLTFRAVARYAGHPLALYSALRPRAAAGYGGVVWTGQHWHLSFSPELFFALKGGHVTTKPMKGTAARENDVMTDMQVAEDLRSDAKQRAENLMIVDLLRNDLSRVCEAGSVDVPELFKIETYPTIHQMISTVVGDLADGKDAVDIIEAIFPCGSITGAPKIRAMQIIDELESDARDLYCGSIGRIDPDGNAAFNVAIRSFSLSEQTKTLSLGLGSGVVADSIERDEWAECLAKGNFARMQRGNFDLIETMRFEPAEGILRLESHLERMKASARAFDFEFDRHNTRNRLHAVTFHLELPSKLRLLLSRSGAIAVEVADAPKVQSQDVSVELIALPVDSGDFRLVHKCTDRAFYDEAREDSQADEIIFIDADGYLTEASRASIFVEREGMLLTPPTSRGLLPGILRRELIESGKAHEHDLRREDLANGFWLGNSLRGLFKAKAVAP